MTDQEELIEFLRHEYSKALMISTVPTHLFTHLAKAILEAGYVKAKKEWEGHGSEWQEMDY